MSRRKVCVVVLTRANYARIAYTLRTIRGHPDLELQLVVGGSTLLYKYGSAVDTVLRDGFEPDATLYSVIEGGTPATMAKSTGLLAIELATVFQQLKPDVVLTIADNFATLATAVAATYMNIPLAHTQGGEVTGSIDESVRHAVTKLAHVHFPATERARDWVVRMGEDPSAVHLVGCPSIDIAAAIDPGRPDDLLDRIGGTGPRISLDEPYLVVVEHPVTTEYGRAFEQIQETLAAVHALGIPAVWFWPNFDAGSDDVSKGLRMYRERNPSAPITFVRNLPADDYLRLISHSVCVVGNSSVGIREAAFLGVPSVNIGTRQQNRERAVNVIDVDHDRTAIAAAVRRQMRNGRYPRSFLYGDGRASERIAHVLGTQELVIQKTLSYVHDTWPAPAAPVAAAGSFDAGTAIAAVPAM